MKLAGAVPLYLAASLFAGCSSVKLVAPQPSAPMKAPVTESAVSNFAFSMQVPLKHLQELANNAVPYHLHDRTGEDFTDALRGDWVSYNVRREELALGFDNGRITFEAPVSGSFSAGGRFRPLPLGRGTSIQETVDFHGRIYGSATPLIDGAWNPVLDPQIDANFDRAKMKLLGFIEISVRGKLKEKLVPRVREEINKLASSFVSDLGLRAQAEKVWQDLHFARQISVDPPIWIRFKPEEVQLRRPFLVEGMLTAGLDIRGNLQTHLAGEVLPPAAGALPPLKLVNDLPEQFRLEIPVVLQEAELGQLVSKSLDQFTYRFENGHRCSLNSTALAVMDDKLLLALDFTVQKNWVTRRMKGRIYLTGTPSLDLSTEILTIPDLDYELESRNVLLLGAEWFLRDDFLRTLRTAAQLELTPLLRRAMQEANRAARSFRLPEGLAGEIALDSLQVTDLKVSHGSIYVATVATGDAPDIRLATDPESEK